jgi:hypothetical protein
MLVNCPKCQFSQPKDKYCANCGIDIDNFKPNKASNRQRLFSNVYFVGGSVLFIIVLGFMVLRHNARPMFQGGNSSNLLAIQKKSLDSEQTNTLSTLDRSQNSNPPTNSENFNPNEAPTTSDPNLIHAKGQDLQAKALTADSPSIDNRLSNQAYDTNNESNIKARVVFTEVSLVELDRIKKGIKLNEAYWGIIPKTQRPIDSTLQTVNKNLDNQSILQFFAGTPSKSENEPALGFNFKIEVYDFIENATTKGYFEILKSFKDTNGTFSRSVVAADFEVPFDNYLYIGGILPRNAKFEDSDIVKGDSFLQIYKKNHFNKQQSEFTIYIDFDKPTASTGRN